jgi:HEAT repeat protein
MHQRFASGKGKSPVGLALQAARLVLLFLPCASLGLVSLRVHGGTSLILWAGTAVLGAGALLTLLSRQAGRDPGGPAVILLCVVGVSWLLLGASGVVDWVLHLAEAVLLVVPLLFFARQCLRDSGAAAMRRARLLAARLAARKDWPADLQACKLMPEVKALRESLHVDASPALELLADSRPVLRVAALAALEFRPSWRPGQPQVVLQLAQRAPDPEVRAAAIFALANIDDRLVLEALAELMRDPSPLVRQTTAEALLWSTEQRWGWIRHALRGALGDPVGQADGALKIAANQLTPEAVADIHTWAGEKGIIALRAALTLGSYYSQVLAAGASLEMLQKMRQKLADPHTPAMVRLELARLLHQYHELDGDDLRKMLDPATPAPVRLIAVEALLGMGPCPQALAALHELARLPNRELALATAEVVQRRLGVDLGLPRGQGLPPVQSRAAAEVARRLLSWATQHDVAGPTSAQRDPASGRAVSSSHVELA